MTTTTVPKEELELQNTICKWTLVIGTASLLTLPIQNQAASVLRHTLTFPAALAGCLLLYRYRTPGTLEKEADRLCEEKQKQSDAWGELEEAKAQLQHDQARFVEQYQVQANQQLAHFNESLEQQRLQYEQTIAQLQQQLALSNAPRFDSGNRTASWNCNKIINYLWHTHSIICDVEEQSQWDYERERYFLKPRNPKDFKKLKSDDLLAELEAVLNEDGGIITVQKGEILIVTFNPGTDTRATTVKKTKAALVAKESSAAKAEDTVERGLGYFVAGESGSGKTAVASYLAQLLAKKRPSTIQKRVLISPNLEACEALVLDPHNNPIWAEIGLQVISEPLKILEALEVIYGEYKERKEHGKTGNKLLVFVDEFEELLAEMGKDLRSLGLKKQEINQKLDEVVDCVRSLATGGRKFCISPIIMNQSWNCSALKLDSNHRNNFVGIFLNTAADNYVQQKCGSQTFEGLRTWLFEERKNKYRAVVCGAFTPQPFLHPTHHDYQEILDGQKPSNLKPVQWLTLSLDVGCKTNEQDVTSVSTSESTSATSDNLLASEDGKPGSQDLKVTSALPTPCPHPPETIENRGKTFVEVRKLRESGHRKTNIIEEQLGYKGRRFKEGLELYESLIDEFAFAWVCDLMNAQEMTQKQIFELVYSPNKSNKEKTKRFKVHYQKVLDRIGNSIAE